MVNFNIYYEGNTVDVNEETEEAESPSSESEDGAASVVLIDSVQYEALVSEIHSLYVCNFSLCVCLLFFSIVRVINSFFGR